MTETQKEEVRKEVFRQLGYILPDVYNCEYVTESIIDDVIRDIEDTADWDGYEDDEINLDDVTMALGRVIVYAIEKYKDND